MSKIIGGYAKDLKAGKKYKVKSKLTGEEFIVSVIDSFSDGLGVKREDGTLGPEVYVDIKQPDTLQKLDEVIEIKGEVNNEQ